MNEMIRAPQVRLVGADGEQVGVVSLEEAIRQAEVANLDCSNLLSKDGDRG